MEQRRMRPTLNRKEFMRVAPHLQKHFTGYNNRKIFNWIPNNKYKTKSILKKNKYYWREKGNYFIGWMVINTNLKPSIIAPAITASRR